MATTDKLRALGLTIENEKKKEANSSERVGKTFGIAADAIDALDTKIENSFKSSMLYLGFDVDTESELTKPTIQNPNTGKTITLVKGHSVRVLNLVDEKGNPYYYQYDGESWNKTDFVALPSDVGNIIDSVIELDNNRYVPIIVFENNEKNLLKTIISWDTVKEYLVFPNIEKTLYNKVTQETLAGDVILMFNDIQDQFNDVNNKISIKSSDKWMLSLLDNNNKVLFGITWNKKIYILGDYIGTSNSISTLNNSDVDIEIIDAINKELIKKANVVHAHSISDIVDYKITTWTPIFSLVKHNSGFVRKLTDYVGGEGVKPVEHLGEYLKSDGYFTSDINQAQLLNIDLSNYLTKDEVNNDNYIEESNTSSEFKVNNNTLLSYADISIKPTTSISGTIRLFSSNKNLFNKSRIDLRRGLPSWGILPSDYRYNVAQPIFVKAGSYTISGLPNSAVSGNNIYVPIYDDNMVNTGYQTVDVRYPKTLNFVNDCWIRIIIKDIDVDTLQIERGNSATHYVQGSFSEMAIHLGTYDGGKPFVLKKLSNDVYDEVKRIGNKYARIQRVSEDGLSALSIPKVVYDGESGFHVEGSLLVDKDFFISINRDVNVSIKYPTTQEAARKNYNKGTTIDRSYKSYIEKNYNSKLLNSYMDVFRDGWYYLAFSTGCYFNQQEIHITRYGNKHDSYASTRSVLVAYIIDGDSVTVKKLNLDYTLGDYRDPNIVVDNTGEHLILTTCVSSNKIDGGYNKDSYSVKSIMYILDKNLNPIQPYKEITDKYFCWGNTLETPSGKLIKSAYKIAIYKEYGVSILKSTGDIDNMGEFKSVAEIFPSDTVAQYSETTISYWGNKLVAIARANKGHGAINWTNDLEGETGWDNYTELPFIVHAPAAEPYIPANEPYVSCISTFEDTDVNILNRRPAFIATANLIDWSKKYYLVDNVAHAGGYASLIRTEDGYSMIWHEDTPVGYNTNLFYTKINRYKQIPTLRQLEYKLNK